MCAPKAGGPSLEGVDVDKEAIVQGVVTRAGEPVGGAYVRLLNEGGDFVAEVPTSASGAFRFFAAPGRWTVRTMAPGATADRVVVARRGVVAELEVTLPG